MPALPAGLVSRMHPGGAPLSSSTAEVTGPEGVEEVVTAPNVPVPPTDPVVEPEPEYELVMGGIAKYEIEDAPVDL